MTKTAKEAVRTRIPMSSRSPTLSDMVWPQLILCTSVPTVDARPMRSPRPSLVMVSPLPSVSGPSPLHHTRSVCGKQQGWPNGVNNLSDWAARLTKTVMGTCVGRLNWQGENVGRQRGDREIVDTPRRSVGALRANGAAWRRSVGALRANEGRGIRRQPQPYPGSDRRPRRTLVTVRLNNPEQLHVIPIYCDEAVLG